MNKKELRANTLNDLKKLNNKYDKENIIFNKLMHHSKFMNAKSIGVTLSMAHEFNTRFLIRYAQITGKTIYVPKCDYKSKEMYFTKYTSPEDITVDSFGIDVMNHDIGKGEAPELMIVPGVRFNKNGYRIGYGGGYYDKYLSNYNGYTISLIFDVQVGEVVVEQHDIPVQYIITESKEWHTGEIQ
ncbi:5-formyltetrahydrofolate cyclo-ligase [Macrococcus armenti]|uniref:5-formyltetrahydrofolate cyclo-ligase n=1 Tax=Macrococcus armenti TaxID=2875764 RepID=A0ABY3ZTM0_9STAP|nr:5-formyltetrahydrofolate cyclo-ligase [Macrococcus armenti]UOB19734.1 5-formyltetrahydrofolate cyclo-ligase [Macrococcus armenti]